MRFIRMLQGAGQGLCGNDRWGVVAGTEASPQAAQRAGRTAAEDERGGEEMRAAAEDMRAAVKDAWHIFGAARASAAALTPMAIEFARDRVDTLRAALSEFMQGYSEGAREVRSLPPGCACAAQSVTAIALYYDDRAVLLPGGACAAARCMPCGPSERLAHHHCL